jgi:hypothetical protein
MDRSAFYKTLSTPGGILYSYYEAQSGFSLRRMGLSYGMIQHVGMSTMGKVARRTTVTEGNSSMLHEA